MTPDNPLYVMSEKGMNAIIRYAKGCPITFTEIDTSPSFTVRPYSVRILDEIAIFRMVNCADKDTMLRSLARIRGEVKLLKSMGKLPIEKLVLKVRVRVEPSYAGETPLEGLESRIAKAFLKNYSGV